MTTKRTYLGWTIERYRSNDATYSWQADKAGQLTPRVDTLEGLRTLIRDMEETS